ncbi:TetR/AcrR family transcriptional regulator [[Clostridium] ultunense Esp]|uniref:TetR/AcrR family transcriptional regulator n=1 Tax=[Clostridium] ultunense Esp TaxID=1288971 RepID=M1ZI64_9FIRM|nr:TetR/AcrR family transcriptional regulator [Schnuerera ultunensis]CCQ98244.1 TetR/AcrR family transcriptional regulator [[Clostridium] ultunense Esp]SHD75991.1 TetR/AcrR family transcriptional regulator [[Clostridium] ultunense Esp]
MNDVNIPKTARGQETMDRICRASEELFSQNGYYNTSITDIAQKAEVAPGTVYIYFKDKVSIFRYLLEDLSYNLRKEIAIATKNCKNRYEEERIGFRVFFDFARKHIGLYKIIWEAQFVDEKLFKEYYDNFASRYVKRIEDAQKNNEMVDINPMTLAYCLMGITNFVGLKWIIFNDEPVPDEVIDDIMRFMKSGIFK